MSEATSTWRFPREFWSANVVELFERMAYYAIFIELALYLTRNYEFSDVHAGWAAAYLAAFIYLVPTFAGAWADRAGFRKALAIAFSLLSTGYFVLGLFGVPAVKEAIGIDTAKASVVVSLSLILMGGSFVKPIISGTVAKASDEANRARAFSIFYMVVNVGAFIGKTLAHPLRTNLGLEYVAFYSSAMAFCGLFVVLIFYRGVDAKGVGKSYAEIGRGLLTVLTNFRFLALILIVGGFWTIQGQLYASMPKYVLRTVGDQANPEWIANINPAVVVILVVPITHLVRKLKPVTSIGIGLFIIPLSALTISLSPLLEEAFGRQMTILGVSTHAITIALCVGIALQGLAECFLSPRFLEYASKQAPPGEEGLYMGYSHLTTFFAWLFGFVISGYLLDAYCPDPTTLPADQHAAYLEAVRTGGSLPQAYADAHYIWYVFAGIGFAAFACLLAFAIITRRIDRRRAARATD